MSTRANTRLFLVAAVALLAAGGCVATPPAKRADGGAIFLRHCAVCHGEKGDGKSIASGALARPPRDFTTIAASENLSREYMIAIVRDGRPHSPMTARAARLSQEEIEAAVDYVRERFIKPR